MGKVQLTKREYLGEGYSFRFQDNFTKQVVFELCSKENYEKMLGGETPTKEGYSFLGGSGGFLCVDSPSYILSENEFTVVEGKHFICLFNSTLNILTITQISEEEFNSKYIWQ